MNCRNCDHPLEQCFVDLGHSPPSNAYREIEELSRPDVYFPLKTYVCSQCFLVQTQDFVSEDSLFNDDYAYLSSTSKSWLAHAKTFSHEAIERLGLDASSYVVEVAANDGYLLKNFVDAGMPCLGIEPTLSAAQIAREKGVPIEVSFFSHAFSEYMKEKYGPADMICGFNVYAHVPDILDFSRGLENAIKPDGVVVLEFPHLLQMIRHSQYDTIYHEHFSYLSVTSAADIFVRCGLKIHDVQHLPTHGGSVRIWGSKVGSIHTATEAVSAALAAEKDFKLDRLETYESCQQEFESVRNDLLEFLIRAKKEGKKVVGYGAAAKGNTMLNFAGIRSDLLAYICDAAHLKIGKYTPGTNIEIKHPDALKSDVVDYVLIMPWNLVDEIVPICRSLCANGTQFVTYCPSLRVVK